MITHEQLTRIKNHLAHMRINQGTTHNFCITDYNTMLAEIERLQTVLAAKDRVLSQFADSENWVVTPPAEDESFYDFSYVGSGNPIHIANQALSEGKE